MKHRACLVSRRTDSITRWNLPAQFNPVRYPVGHAGPDELVFGEDREPVNALRVAVLRQGNRTRRTFRPREQEHLALRDCNRQAVIGANENLETRLKYLPRPRPWAGKPDYITGQIAVVLFRN